MAERRNQVFLIFFCGLLGASLEQSLQRNGNQCGGLTCSQGRMCVTRADGQAECQCPTSCQASREERVCTVYGFEFRNPCELHRYACAKRVNIAVRNKGICQNQGKRICNRWRLSRFSNRYLEISHMRMMSRGSKIVKHVRTEYMSRKTKHAVLMFELRRHDANKNDRLDSREWTSVIADFYPFNYCISGFLRSCDVDGSGDIARSEWLEGFGYTVSTTPRPTTTRTPTTTPKPTTAQEPTTTKKPTTTEKSTTTEKLTTTQEPTTTKKPTTTPTPCTKICPAGKLNADCSACDCVDHILRGRVVTTAGEPLAGANVSLTRDPGQVIAKTGISGYFFHAGLCVDEESFTIQRQGYFPIVMRATIESKDSSRFLAKLQDAVPPVVIVHPEDQVGFRGRGVTFCCKGKGSPTPAVEWYRNGRLLDRVRYNYGETLFIPDASRMTGNFKCRVVNSLGAEFSDVADLKLYDTRTSRCQSKPKAAVVSLPEGCTESATGRNQVDLGQCERSGDCFSRDVHDQRSCKQKEYCCGIKTTEPVNITCRSGAVKVELVRVTACGCSKCEERDTVITGLVVGGKNEIAIASSSVMVDGERWAVTDDNGRFRLLVPKDTKRLIVTVLDVDSDFAPTTKQLAFLKGRTVFRKIVLLPQDPPVEFDSEKKLQLPLGHIRGEASVAEIEVPEKSLMTQDGKNFTGRARVTVTYMDTRNITDVEAAPGDFTTVDPNGQEQRLKSYGMLKVGFVDEKNKRLDLVKNMTLKFDPEEVGLNPRGNPPNLWWLDEKTGRWVDAGKLTPVVDKTRRSKRSSRDPKTFFVGNITTDKLRWINIDVPARTCHLKVKVSAKYKGEDKGPISSAEIHWIGQENNNFYGFETGVTDSEGFVCLKSWCDNYGYLQAKAFSRALTPDALQLKKLPPSVKAEVIHNNNIKSIKMRSTQNLPTNGPVFEDEDRVKCRNDKSALYFGFHVGLNKRLMEILFPNTSLTLPHSSDRRCYIKVIASVGGYSWYEDKTKVTLMVESFSADGTERYGYVTQQMEVIMVKGQDRQVNMACVEYRCSENSPTHVKVSVYGGKEFKYSHLQRELQKAQPDKADLWNCKKKNQRDFIVTEREQEGLGQSVGLYAGFEDEGKNACRLGSDIGFGDAMPTSTVKDYTLFFDFSDDWLECDYCGNENAMPEIAKQFCSSNDPNDIELT